MERYPCNHWYYLNHSVVQFATSLVRVDEKGYCNIVITHPTGFTHKLEKVTVVAEASETECVQVNDDAMNKKSGSNAREEVLKMGRGIGGKDVGVLGGAGGQDGSGGSGGWGAGWQGVGGGGDRSDRLWCWKTDQGGELCKW